MCHIGLSAESYDTLVDNNLIIVSSIKTRCIKITYISITINNENWRKEKKENDS